MIICGTQSLPSMSYNPNFIIYLTVYLINIYLLNL